MRPASCLLAITAIALAGCRSVPPELKLIEDTAQAMGGKDKVLSTTSLVVEGEGENWNFGQNRTPDGELPAYKVSGFKRQYDFVKNRWRLEQTRTPTFLTGNPAPQRQYQQVDGDVAFDVAGNGVIQRHPALIAKQRRDEIVHSPVGVMRVALAEGAKLSNLRSEAGREFIDVVTSEGTTVHLEIDAATRLPAKVRSMIDHPNLGDIYLETEFADYRDAGGLQMPGRYVTRMDGKMVAQITATQTGLNNAADLTSPPPAASATVTANLANVVVEQPAPGIWYMVGQSHHSLVVEFEDHLTLVEAPQSEARTLAVIAKARELRTGKPLTTVIPTHHHFDHSAGIRAAVAEGLKIVTHAGNRKFFEDVVARPHTVAPDQLAKAPKPLGIETFEGEYTKKDGKMSLVVYPIENSQHASPFLMVYLPTAKMLFQADAYSPAAADANPPPRFPFAPGLMENISSRKLVVERLLPAHGRMVPMADLQTAATAQAPTGQ